MIRVKREGSASVDREPGAAAHQAAGQLKSRSEDFVRLWALRDVRVNGRGRKRLPHPRVGPLDVDFEVLSPLQDADQRLTIYRASDTASNDAVRVIRF
jgi:hypothetical protein